MRDSRPAHAKKTLATSAAWRWQAVRPRVVVGNDLDIYEARHHSLNSPPRWTRRKGGWWRGCGYHDNVIDSHCHLADETFAKDLDQVVARAKGAGLERVMVILEGDNAQEAEQAARLA